MDVKQRVEDLTNTALDERGNNNERFNAAIGALRIIREYKLLSNKRIDVAINILNKFTSPDFVEGIATRAEKFADGFDRVKRAGESIMGSVEKISRAGGETRSKRRRYR